MPKILENVKEALICEAKRQIAEQGYKATTIRSVAAGCGIAVGTVYNYFSSKDMLVASFILEDWIAMLEDLKQRRHSSPEENLFAIHNALIEFARKHASIFSDKDAVSTYYSVFYEKHKLLRHQLADLILPLVRESEFEAEFIAESMLTWTMAGKSFDEIYSVIKKIII